MGNTHGAEVGVGCIVSCSSMDWARVPNTWTDSMDIKSLQNSNSVRSMWDIIVVTSFTVYLQCVILSKETRALYGYCFVTLHGRFRSPPWQGRADSRLVPSQWETSLQSNAVSHWLGTNLESALQGKKIGLVMRQLRRYAVTAHTVGGKEDQTAVINHPINVIYCRL